jgi:hypothetical protein
MPRIHDIMAVHGVGEQLRTDTLSTFAEHFYKSVRKAVLDAGQDPNTKVKLVGRYQENYIEVHYQDEEIFRLWEISWERSFIVPGARAVLSWLWQWSSLYLNWAYSQRRDKETRYNGRGPLPRTILLLFALLDLTLIAPLLAALYWILAADKQVRYQKTHDGPVDEEILSQHRFATGLALALSVPLIMGLQLLARLGRAGAGLPLVGRFAAGMARKIDTVVVGLLGDAMLYIFDSIQAAFIRGDLEKAIEKVIERAHQEAEKDGREPLIHIFGHSLGSVIAYEAVSHSLTPEKRQSIKTLCTMGTVMDMIRYVLSSGGLVLEEQVRFGQDIPRQEQGKTYPRWLNLFARNDPATGFSPLLEFDQDPTNRPVCSTSKGHSTYWTDVLGVYRPFLAWVAHDNPIFNRVPEPPPLSCQHSILKDVARVFGILLLLALAIAAAVLVGEWQGIELLSDLAPLVAGLLGWYLKWLLGLGGLLLLWAIFLGLPTWLRTVWRWFEYRRLVPLDRHASLNYWIDPLQWMGPDYVLALRKKDIWSLHDFLVAVVRPGGPARLADLLDVPQQRVLQWASQANLMRLRGVGFEESALLMAAAVDSLATLSRQERDALIKRQPALKADQVDYWIERAKTLKDVI